MMVVLRARKRPDVCTSSRAFEYARTSSSHGYDLPGQEERPGCVLLPRDVSSFSWYIEATSRSMPRSPQRPARAQERYCNVRLRCRCSSAVHELPLDDVRVRVVGGCVGAHGSTRTGHPYPCTGARSVLPEATGFGGNRSGLLVFLGVR